MNKTATTGDVNYFVRYVQQNGSAYDCSPVNRNTAAGASGSTGFGCTINNTIPAYDNGTIQLWANNSAGTFTLDGTIHAFTHGGLPTGSGNVNSAGTSTASTTLAVMKNQTVYALHDGVDGVGFGGYSVRGSVSGAVAYFQFRVLNLTSGAMVWESVPERRTLGTSDGVKIQQGAAQNLTQGYYVFQILANVSTGTLFIDSDGIALFIADSEAMTAYVLPPSLVTFFSPENMTYSLNWTYIPIWFTQGRSPSGLNITGYDIILYTSKIGRAHV